MTDPDRTALLAEWVVSRRYSDLSETDIAQLEVLLIDHLGCASRGAYLPWGRSLCDWATSYGGSGQSIVIGSDLKTSAPIAALLNATAAHGMELDDTHDASLTHPGAAVIATALAVASETGANGEDVLAAIATGYEATGRAGMATGASILERGFHPTALFGGFGAAAVAARLYGLDAQGLQDAWGLLLSMVGGSAQFSQDARGTVVKRLHGGYGAKNGILAAQLAGKGISGPARALDGTYGLVHLYGAGDKRPEKLDPNDDRPLAIDAISLKPYPCCRLFHSTIDALRDIVGELPYGTPDDIETIRIGGPNVLPTQHMMTRPTSMMAAQYSLPYSLAAALNAGPYDMTVFAEDRLDDPARTSIADKVSCVADETMQAAFPDHFGSWAEVQFSDGSVQRVDRLDSYGTPAAPMSRDAVIEKVDGLLKDTELGVDGAVLAEHASALKTQTDVNSLTQPLADSRALTH